MRENLQKVVLTLACLSALSVNAGARSSQPTTAVPVVGGWTARFFVSPSSAPPGIAQGPALVTAPLGITAQFSRHLWRGARLTVDLGNVLEREAAAPSGLLAPPAQGRSIQFSLRATF